MNGTAPAVTPSTATQRNSSPFIACIVGVQFQLVNTGEAACSDSPSNGAQAADSERRQFDATFGDITAGPSMASGLKLKPGAKGLGWIVFEVPEAAKVDTVQFTMDSGFADETDETGEWLLR
ncbi:DUF4352 domain-containing protein [Streptomyces sp. NPDC006999]|uniref:DUF4352 domain-containing protein n=1 Tax=Streptomyces sp. NPDC006999 TaxID=3156909 RepID=UPI003411CA26